MLFTALASCTVNKKGKRQRPAEPQAKDLGVGLDELFFFPLAKCVILLKEQGCAARAAHRPFVDLLEAVLAAFLAVLHLSYRSQKQKNDHRDNQKVEEVVDEEAMVDCDSSITTGSS